MAINLQLGGFAEPVQKIIDEHKRKLPEVSKQTVADRQWRLALHRIDLRGLAPKEIELEGTANGEAPSKQAFILEPQGIEEDIQEMLDEGAPAQQRFNEDMGLFNWAVQKFHRKVVEESGDKTWEKMLARAKALAEEKVEDDEQLPLSFQAPRYAAAAIVRDHWDDLTPDDRKWCLEMLIESLQRGMDESGDYVFMAKNMLDPSRPAAFCMPIILGKVLSADLKPVAMKGLAIALTHSTKEVIACAAQGVGVHLWQNDPGLAEYITSAMVQRTNDIDRLLKEDDKLDYVKRRGFFSITSEVNVKVRKLIEESGDVSSEEIAKLKMLGRHTRYDVDVLLALVQDPGEESFPRLIYAKSIDALVHWWNLDKRTRRESERVPHEQLLTIVERTASYALLLPTADGLKFCEPVLELVDKNFQDVAKFVQYIINAEDQLRTGAHFWALWQAFADQLKSAKWLTKLDSDYPGYDSLITAVFFGPAATSKRFHWPPLDGHAKDVDELALALPAHHRVLDEYVMFLYCMGEKSLPDAFVTLTGIVGRGDAKLLLSQSNTVFCLDRMLQQYVYGLPRMLKEKPALREAVLKLLDALVEAGSSAAYRMRDDFVTPLAG